MSGKCPLLSAKNERQMRERRNGDARQKQRKSRDRTKKEQRNAAHLLADYQPPKRTKKTPEKERNWKNWTP